MSSKKGRKGTALKMLTFVLAKWYIYRTGDRWILRVSIGIKGNSGKCQKHGVSIAEIEAMFGGTVLVASDPAHSVKEERFKAIGTNAEGRKILVAFTLRTRDGETFLRPVSARYMHQKEIRTYEKETSGPDH